MTTENDKDFALKVTVTSMDRFTVAWPNRRSPGGRLYTEEALAEACIQLVGKPVRPNQESGFSDMVATVQSAVIMEDTGELVVELARLPGKSLYGMVPVLDLEGLAEGWPGMVTVTKITGANGLLLTVPEDAVWTDPGGITPSDIQDLAPMEVHDQIMANRAADRPDADQPALCRGCHEVHPKSQACVPNPVWLGDPIDIEELAAAEHESWSGWTRWMLKSIKDDARESLEDTLSFLEGFESLQCIQRWRRQMGTDYEHLSEKEKESDRIEARKKIAVYRGAVLTESGS